MTQCGWNLLQGGNHQQDTGQRQVLVLDLGDQNTTPGKKFDREQVGFRQQEEICWSALQRHDGSNHILC
jgi:hypothetical protein